VTVYLDAIPSHLDVVACKRLRPQAFASTRPRLRAHMKSASTQCCNKSRALNVALASCFKVGYVNHSIRRHHPVRANQFFILPRGVDRR